MHKPRLGAISRRGYHQGNPNPPLHENPDRINRRIPTNGPASKLPSYSSYETIAASASDLEPELQSSEMTASVEEGTLSNITDEVPSDGEKKGADPSVTETHVKINIGPWELGVDIGAGGCGTVRQCRHMTTGLEAAVKVIKKNEADGARAASLTSLIVATKKPGGLLDKSRDHALPYGVEREVVIMKLLEHDNIVKLYDVWEDEDKLYIIMERMTGGELFSAIFNNGYFAEETAVWVLRQVIAALLHCHRLGIHHRDVKPENILLNHDYPPTAKLADFGMSCLQPHGTVLKTPCGSVHYAAPEVFAKHYDGNKTDVWSLGVILYTMMAGTLPYVWDQDTMTDQIDAWVEKITNEPFHMPSWFSPEAQDILVKMIHPDPDKRLTMEQCWHHPLVQKWCDRWSAKDRLSGNLERWIGKPPTLHGWNHLNSPDEIDMGIFRGLQTLWHRESEDALIAKLMNNFSNQEKYFYLKLIQHRDEALENWNTNLGTFEHSEGDYHHLKQPPRLSQLPAVPPSAYVRCKSAYSLMSPRGTSRSTLHDVARSERSYDPYRSSRSQVVPTDKHGYNVTLLNSGTNGARAIRTTQLGRTNYPLRVDVLKEQNRLSAASRSSNSMGSSQRIGREGSRGARVSFSKSSLTGSSIVSNVPVGIKPTIAHRRPVNFSHMRQNSIANELTLIKSPRKLGREAKKTTFGSAESVELRSSPDTQVKTVVISRKERLDESPSKQIARHLARSAIELEARKVSTELEKYCEELFYPPSNEPSIDSLLQPQLSASSSQRSQKGLNFITPTPSTSIKNTALDYTQDTTNVYNTPVHGSASGTTALDLDKETPTTFINRELAEFRRRLADRYSAGDLSRNAAYDDVMSHLNNLMNHGKEEKDAKRISSAPSIPKADRSSDLTSIMAKANVRNFEALPQHRSKDARAATDPLVRLQRGQARVPDPTIRVVEPSSPPPPEIAPLVIRKVSSNIGPKSNQAASNVENIYSTDDRPQIKHAIQHITKADSLQKLRGPRIPLAPVTGNNKSVQPVREDTKATWVSSEWRNSKDSSAMLTLHDTLNQPPPKIPFTFQTFDDRLQPELGRARPIKMSPNPFASPHLYHPMGSELSLRCPPAKNGGFFNFWKKRKPKHGGWTLADETFDSASFIDSLERSEGNTASNNTITLSTGQRLSSNAPPAQLKDLGVQQNWFARFFRIKPATRVVCFDRGIGITRTELVKTLRSWKQYGIRDVHFDREKNLIWGRLSAHNLLCIKEASFAIQLFVVLKEDQRAKLSIARFTQTRGSASSFRRVVEYIETVLDARNLLVTDPKVKTELNDLLNG